MKPFVAGKKIFLRSLGKDEHWLRNELLSNPALLPFLNIQQSDCCSPDDSLPVDGGIHLLLTSEKDDAVYVMTAVLGESGPEHFFRCIESWDTARRRSPGRHHIAVLIAEGFDPKNANVMQIVSRNIPMVTVQLDVIETAESYILHCTEVIVSHTRASEEAGRAAIPDDLPDEGAQWANIADLPPWDGSQKR